MEHMVEIAFCAVRRVILEGRLYVYDKWKVILYGQGYTKSICTVDG